jgi:hypothetical protein
MQLMALNIHILYKAPSKERLFLGSGWSLVRDVRGPYLSAPVAEIVIDNWALSSKVASTLEFTLSVSNRCEVDTVFVQATGDFGSTQTPVKRNNQCILTITGILADPTRDHTVITLKSAFDSEGKVAVMAGMLDIVAIDEFRLIR